MASAIALARATLARRGVVSDTPVSSFHGLGIETMKQVAAPMPVSSETRRETVFETQRRGLTSEVVSWHVGLARLAAVPPPAGISQSVWGGRIAHAQQFCDRLGPQAEAIGWVASDLFALHPDAPLRRFDAMGAAFIGLDGEAIEVTVEAVVIHAQSGLRQFARRRHISFAPAWETFGLNAPSQSISENLPRG